MNASEIALCSLKSEQHSAGNNGLNVSSALCIVDNKHMKLIRGSRRNLSLTIRPLHNTKIISLVY